MNYGETLSNLPAAIAVAPNKYIERTMRLTRKMFENQRFSNPSNCSSAEPLRTILPPEEENYQKYKPLCEHTEKVGKITFIVSSFADSTAEKKPEQLILQLLENKINEEKTEESA